MTERAADITLALLRSRSAGATVCPSEVARAITSGPCWRAAMPTVHAAVDRLLAERLVEISWKGQRLTNRAGPYRIGWRNSHDPGALPS